MAVGSPQKFAQGSVRMDILVSGSMAFDRIMDFSGRFVDHFAADRLDNINVSLMVNGLTENLGGTAGNIAYALSSLGEKPRILACVGKDHQSYFDWLGQHGISTQDIRVLSEEWTASAYITTDQDGNQFTAFNPGAMMHTSDIDLTSVTPADTIVTSKGDAGCDIVTREGTVTVPVVPTPNAIDPTGAGDAFRGGLIKGLIDAKPIQRCVEMGTVAAHYAVQVAGTQTYTFTQAEFAATLEGCFGA